MLTVTRITDVCEDLLGGTVGVMEFSRKSVITAATTLYEAAIVAAKSLPGVQKVKFMAQAAADFNQLAKCMLLPGQSAKDLVHPALYRLAVKSSAAAAPAVAGPGAAASSSG